MLCGDACVIRNTQAVDGGATLVPPYSSLRIPVRTTGYLPAPAVSQTLTSTGRTDIPCGPHVCPSLLDIRRTPGPLFVISRRVSITVVVLEVDPGRRGQG